MKKRKISVENKPLSELPLPKLKLYKNKDYSTIKSIDEKEQKDAIVFDSVLDKKFLDDYFNLS